MSSRLREDVHVHAPADALYALLLDPQARRRWLPPAFEQVDGADGELRFTLTLPFRREPARLSVSAADPPRALTLGAADGASAITALTWILDAETPREVHLTVDAAFRGAKGFAGWLAESLVFAPHRRQALRDALWRLKLLAEGRR